MARNIPLQKHYDRLGPVVVRNLRARQFEAWYCPDAAQARDQILQLLPREELIAWGGSLTLEALGILDLLRGPGWQVIDRDRAETPQQRDDLMRRALTCDTFLTGCNAISEDGQLVNIDGRGNRVAAMAFGPKRVIVVAGMNKVTATLNDALHRARTLAAPANAQRFEIQTPCVTAGGCRNCNSPDSICTYVVTTRHSSPPGRIQVVLVGQELGL